MKSTKKITATAKLKIPVKTGKGTIQKIRSPYSIIFPIAENVDFSDCEIRIMVKENQVVAKFFLKGVLEAHQVLPAKKIPGPPPMPGGDIIKILEQIRLKFNTK